jgi:hypothetical protein
MHKTTATIFGFLVLALGITGLLAGDKQLFGFINVDILLDISRIGLAGLLLYAVYANRGDNFTRTTLFIFAGLYLIIAIGGMISPTMGGLLPSGLSGFDILFHLTAGLIALYAGATQERHITHHA